MSFWLQSSSIVRKTKVFIISLDPFQTRWVPHVSWHDYFRIGKSFYNYKRVQNRYVSIRQSTSRSFRKVTAPTYDWDLIIPKG